MKALSFRQPWAQLIVTGIPVIELSPPDEKGYQHIDLKQTKVAFKDIENRAWRLPARMRGQRIYVHAAKRVDEAALFWLLRQGFPPIVVLPYFGDRVPKGAIVGEVDLEDCVTESPSGWFTGPYGFVLRNPCPYPMPIPCKGQRGFFEPEIS